MPVNNNTAPLYFSEVQSFYGGSNPIYANEYYRGGAEVPTTRTLLAAGGSSGGDVGESGVTRDGILITVDDIPGGTVPGSLSFQTVGSSSSVGGWFTSGSGPERNGFQRGNVDANTSFIRIGYARTQGTINWTVRNSSNAIVATGTGATPGVRGPAWRSGDAGLGRTAAQVAAFPQVGAGGYIILSWRGNAPSRDGSGGRATRSSITTPTTYNITMRNNTGQTLNFTSSPTGNDASFTNGEMRSVTGQSSPNWSFSYPAVTASDANSNIPASGNPLDLGDFRSVTNPTG